MIKCDIIPERFGEYLAPKGGARFRIAYYVDQDGIEQLKKWVSDKFPNSYKPGKDTANEINSEELPGDKFGPVLQFDCPSKATRFALQAEIAAQRMHKYIDGDLASRPSPEQPALLKVPSFPSLDEATESPPAESAEPAFAEDTDAESTDELAGVPQSLLDELKDPDLFKMVQQILERSPQQ